MRDVLKTFGWLLLTAAILAAGIWLVLPPVIHP